MIAFTVGYIVGAISMLLLVSVLLILRQAAEAEAEDYHDD